MRVVLVDNLLIEQNGDRVETVLQPHLGLISLLAVLERAGHDCALYDPKLALAEGQLSLESGLYAAIARHILELRPDVVGLTSLGCNFICTLRVALHLRELKPGLKLMLGGPHATILDRAILARYPVFDVILRHEAEHTLPAVLENLQSGKLDGIPGISYRAEGRVVANAGAPLIEDLDLLPTPAYRHYPIDRLRLPWLRVEAGRGCPFMCTFCSTASFFGRRYRLKSADRLCAELEALNREYGVSQFSLQHDLFTVNRDKVLEFCEAVRQRGFVWKCSARMDCVDAELMREMARAGCREIYFGVETGSPRLQELAKKRLDLGLFYPTLEAAAAVDIHPTVSFITGYPQERARDQAATLDMVGSAFYLRPPPANVQLHLMTPEPGTELLDQYRDRLRFDGFISDFTFPTVERDDPELIGQAPEVFMNNHYFEAELPRRRHTLVSTLYYVLYDLSPPVLCLLLDQFGGRLSSLVDCFDEWAAREGLSVACKASFNGFVLKTFGLEHYVTSLVRYMMALSSMPRPSRRQVVQDRSEHAVLRAKRAYELNPDATILKDIHDCPALLAELEKLHALRVAEASPAMEFVGEQTPTDGLIPLGRKRGAASIATLRLEEDRWAGLLKRFSPVHLEPNERGNFIVVPVSEGGLVRTLPLDAAAESLLSLFKKPRSLTEIKRVFQRSTPLALELLDEMIEAELLVQATRAVSRRPPTRTRGQLTVASMQRPL